MEDDNLPPPTYNEATTCSSNLPTPSPLAPTLHASSITAHLADHLTSLPARIRATQAAHSSNQAAQDLELITLLVPHVEAFLSDLGCLPRSPPVAELTLVPAATVPAAWALSGAAERQREGDVVRVVRVSPAPAKLESGAAAAAGDSKQALEPEAPTGERAWDSSREFDSWGRWDADRPDLSGASGSDTTTWWWRDENMALRLASYLQPRTQSTPQPASLERQKVQATVERVREERRGSSWLRKVVSSSDTASSSSSSSRGKGNSAAGASAAVIPQQRPVVDDRVTMRVGGQEVTFRRENDFGIWETMSGFGIVVWVQIRSQR